MAEAEWKRNETSQLDVPRAAWKRSSAAAKASCPSPLHLSPKNFTALVATFLCRFSRSSKDLGRLRKTEEGRKSSTYKFTSSEWSQRGWGHHFLDHSSSSPLGSAGSSQHSRILILHPWKPLWLRRKRSTWSCWSCCPAENKWIMRSSSCLLLFLPGRVVRDAPGASFYPL